jgi:hypothetical protein
MSEKVRKGKERPTRLQCRKARRGVSDLLQGRLEWCEGASPQLLIGVILPPGSHIYPGSSDV